MIKVLVWRIRIAMSETSKPAPMPPSKVRLDFTQAHYLDHSIWCCHDQPGGRQRHLYLRWQFHWRSALLARTKCRLWHTPTDAWYGKGMSIRHYVVCRHCLTKLGVYPQAEREEDTDGR